MFNAVQLQTDAFVSIFNFRHRAECDVDPRRNAGERSGADRAGRRGRAGQRRRPRAEQCFRESFRNRRAECRDHRSFKKE